ncbi:SoxR reducing system RseC family protein, partial [Psittacicella gerlachiana]
MNNNVIKNAQVESISYDNSKATIRARILTNKEFCSACARGEGCGAIFFNQLTPLGRNKNLVKITADSNLIQDDNLQVGDIIKLETSRQSFWLAISTFYSIPLVFAVVIPSIIFNKLNLSDLTTALLIFTFLAIYY